MLMTDDNISLLEEAFTKTTIFKDLTETFDSYNEAIGIIDDRINDLTETIEKIIFALQKIIDHEGLTITTDEGKELFFDYL